MEQLRGILRRIDRRGYKAYKELRGQYDFPDFTLRVDHVQGDPFADPSRVAVRVPLAATWCGTRWQESRVSRVALRDFVGRLMGQALERCGKQKRGSGKSGVLRMDRPGQQVLDRSSCILDGGVLEVRLRMGLPAAGRSVLAREAEAMFFEEVPRAVAEALLATADHGAAARRHVTAVEDAHALRSQLASAGLVAFVAEGAILPRRSGIDDRPLARGAVPFGPVPDSLAVTLETPHSGPVRGMGISRGVTLIVGGGYHGKSTLLEALSRGIYDHVPGDGREQVVTDPAAFFIRAEDGRRVEKVPISPFITELPGGRTTGAFCSEDASGSTSQAANIVEALEAGATTLLVDEDTSATNFMIRDHRMQLLVAAEQEPIVPFVDRVQALHRQEGIATVLVLGGSGDYFDVADTVIQMAEYRPLDVTEQARAICAEVPSKRSPEERSVLALGPHRVPLPRSFDPSRGRRAEKVRSLATRAILFGREEIDLSLVQQLVDDSQTRYVADVMLYLHRHQVDGRRTLPELLDAAEAAFGEEGFDGLSRERWGDRAVARRLEIAAAINRLRTLQVR